MRQQRKIRNHERERERERKYKNSEIVSKRKKQNFECKNKISQKTLEQQKK